MRTLTLLFFCLLLSPLLRAQYNLLFIGNSLSYSNDLPSLLSEVALANDQEWQTSCLCYPNFGLEDHVAAPKTKKTLLESNHDWVIFQQGPSSQAYGKTSLIQYGDSLARWSRAGGATPALLMVWTSEAWSATWPQVIQHHVEAAAEIEGTMVDVGLHWKRYIDTYPDHGLYTSDGFHPSLLGSQFTAMIIYRSLSGAGVLRIPEEWMLSKKEEKRLVTFFSE